jgi:glycosyltransferase involved in cell wall biosynthesis
MPVLEAFRCGAPVAASTGGALPEVAGDAAVFFDPRDEVEMAETLARLCGDGSLRQDLVRRGSARVEGMTWARTAEETLRVYREAHRDR